MYDTLAMLLAIILTFFLAHPVNVTITPKAGAPRCYYGRIQAELRCPTTPHPEVHR
jgi:hypothetical protein